MSPVQRGAGGSPTRAVVGSGDQAGAVALCLRCAGVAARGDRARADDGERQTAVRGGHRGRWRCCGRPDTPVQPVSAAPPGPLHARTPVATRGFTPGVSKPARSSKTCPAPSPRLSPSPRPDPSATGFTPIRVLPQDTGRLSANDTAVVACPTCDGGARVGYPAGTSRLAVLVDVPNGQHPDGHGRARVPRYPHQERRLGRRGAGRSADDWCRLRDPPMVLGCRRGPSGRAGRPEVFNDHGPALDVSKPTFS